MGVPSDRSPRHLGRAFKGLRRGFFCLRAIASAKRPSWSSTFDTKTPGAKAAPLMAGGRDLHLEATSQQTARRPALLLMTHIRTDGCPRCARSRSPSHLSLFPRVAARHYHMAQLAWVRSQTHKRKGDVLGHIALSRLWKVCLI